MDDFTFDSKIMAKICSINISLPKTVPLVNGQSMRSGIFKKPVEGKIYLDTEGFQGDGVANRMIHGGEDKAVCGYPLEHYSYWEKKLGWKLSAGTFGENLTLSGLLENNTCIGDIFQFGEAEIQCAQPRLPCQKINKVFMTKEMSAYMRDTGYCGFYFRVLKSGWAQENMELKKTHSDPAGFSIQMALDLMYKDRENYELMVKLLAIEALSQSWRETFRQRFEKHFPDYKSKHLE